MRSALIDSAVQTLNLSGLPYLGSSDLEGLLSDDKECPPLEVLILNNTAVGDDAAPFISCCTSLRVLELGSTKFTSKGFQWCATIAQHFFD